MSRRAIARVGSFYFVRFSRKKMEFSMSIELARTELFQVHSFPDCPHITDIVDTGAASAGAENKPFLGSTMSSCGQSDQEGPLFLELLFVTRANIDIELFYKDERIDYLAVLCKETRLVTEARIARVWSHGYMSASDVMDTARVDIQALWAGDTPFVELMGRAQLAEPAGEPGAWRIKGLAERIAELVAYREEKARDGRAGGKASAESRRRKFGSAQPRKAGPPAERPEPSFEDVREFPEASFENRSGPDINSELLAEEANALPPERLLERLPNDVRTNVPNAEAQLLSNSDTQKEEITPPKGSPGDGPPRPPNDRTARELAKAAGRDAAFEVFRVTGQDGAVGPPKIDRLTSRARTLLLACYGSWEGFFDEATRAHRNGNLVAFKARVVEEFEAKCMLSLGSFRGAAPPQLETADEVLQVH